MIYAHAIHHNVGWLAYLSKRLRGWINQRLLRSMTPMRPGLQCVFVAGCGHSGTTLLTAKLGNHPAAKAIGYESKIFVPTHSALKARRMYLRWLEEARLEGKSHLIEKTPKHVHALPEILHLLPTAKVVLTVRNPLDNCYSIHERFGDLEYGIQRWLLDNESVERMKGHPSVKVVHYEHLASEPEACLAEVCRFLGMHEDPSLAAGGATVFDRQFSSLNMNLRREQVKQPIRLVTRKWAPAWSAAQAEEVRHRTRELALKLGYSEDDLR